MAGISTRLCQPLEERTATAFFVAGGLLLASPTHIVVERVLEVQLPSWVVALFIIPGLMTALLGLVGMYPRLVDRAPRLALAGGVTAGLAGTILAVIFGWILGGTLVSAVPGIVIGLPPRGLFSTFALTMTLGFFLFGFATLRSPDLPPSLGLLLLSFVVPWLAALVATAVFGSAVPEWLTLAIYGPIPFIMLATGYTLRVGAIPTGRTDPSADVATG